MNKKAFLDPDVIMSPGFILLGGGAILATVMGYAWGKSFDSGLTWPLWQLLVIILAELVAAYFFAARG